MTARRPAPEVRPVAFGSEPASAPPEQADRFGAVPAWAKSAASSAAKAWVPKSQVKPPEPAASAAPPPRAPPEGPFEPSAEPMAQEPTPVSSDEPALAPGMIVMSEEELAERDAEVVDAARAPYREALQRLMRVIGELEQRLREDVVDLAGRIASVLTHREIKADRTITLDIAQRALRLLGPLERVIVKCAESDAELLREHLPALARSEAGRAVEVIVRPSDDIAPGGLVLTFDGGVVDAREERRLDRIIQAVKVAVQEQDAIFDGEEPGGQP